MVSDTDLAHVIAFVS